MKVNDYFHIALKNVTSNRKKSLYYIIFLVLVIIISLVVLTFNMSINKYVNVSIYKQPIMRTFSLIYDPDTLDKKKIIEELENFDYIVRIFDEYEYEAGIFVPEFETNERSGYLYVNAAYKNTVPKVTYGRMFEENERKVAICPEDFLPHGDDSNVFMEKNNFLNGKNMIGSSLNFAYDENITENGRLKLVSVHNYEFKVIGVYNAPNSFINSNVCFVNPLDVEMINKAMYGIDEIDENTPFLRILLDDVDSSEIFHKDIDILSEKLNASIGIDSVFKLDITTVKMIEKISYLIVGITLWIFLVCMVFYMKKVVKDQAKEIGLLKTFGFKNKQIINIIINEHIFLVSISYIISLIIYLILVSIYFIIQKNVYLDLYKFSVSLPVVYPVILILVLYVIVLMASIINVKKIVQINPAIIVKD